MRDDKRLRAELRKSLGTQARRAGPLVAMWRWKVELLALGSFVTCLIEFGRTPTLLAASGVAVVVLLACAVLPSVAAIVTGLLQRVIVPHRLRSGIVNAGLANRRGRIPWILPARSGSWGVVAVRLRLPAGVSGEDVDDARDDLAAACGAAEVVVWAISARRDRVGVCVIGPRWGMPGR